MMDIIAEKIKIGKFLKESFVCDNCIHRGERGHWQGWACYHPDNTNIEHPEVKVGDIACNKMRFRKYNKPVSDVISVVKRLAVDENE